MASLQAAENPPARKPSRRAWKRWLKRVGIAAALGLLSAGGILWFVLPYTILRPSRMERWAVYHGRTPADVGLQATNLSVRVEPDIWLRGWYIPTEKPPAKGTMILLHGHASCKESALGLAKLFSDQGYNCLLYDSRAHGESGGEYCTFGYYEKRDCSLVLDEAQKRFGPLGPVGILGDSLGAAVAVQTMAVEPRIRCGVVQSPFASLRLVVHDYMRHYSGIPFFFISDLTLARAAGLAKFPASEVQPQEAASRIRCPVLLLHGDQDHWIAFQQGQSVFRHLTSPGSRFVRVAGGDHGNLWQVGGPAYQQTVLDFLVTHLR